MKISTKSWHYKLASIKSDPYHPSDSLCIYFWQVVIGLLIVSAITGIGCVAAFLTLSPILMWFVDGIDELGMLMTVIFVFAGSAYFGKQLLCKAVEKASTTTFIGVTKEWVSAKKKRICPRLDFVD